MNYIQDQQTQGKAELCELDWVYIIIQSNITHLAKNEVQFFGDFSLGETKWSKIIFEMTCCGSLQNKLNYWKCLNTYMLIVLLIFFWILNYF